ncbi:class III lanthionine synthetase LanKC [Streptomyces albipurpureus]|uniref:non-specific serine/threonine protein kinase n=1 Tax=Streptomyces albipurpureus TaxID=2897419 RepID=A0ABT0UWI9_9ACTN|nr:class III lanthionine synthetase LanKC [Streptomyces sp. CWNU-1]MCM2392762.1 class III lanthionine synthetase LanKC [Streptomyces sp. CWNU-1]
MNPEYATYCSADRDFYDVPHRSPSGSDAPTAASDAQSGYYGPAREVAPEGWDRSRRGDWLSYSPMGLRIPQQGWKIHISATLNNAESILRRVFDYCVARRLPVKFIPSPPLLLLRNAKYADRAGSGKFITVYPHSEESFPEVCGDLMELLDGEEGPYILSDLRCADGPVHVRYGAFAPRFCTGPDGRLVPAVADPSGTLVPDPRGPSLRIPEWVTPPAFLAPYLEARTSVGMDDMPYEISGALHFSNGGGVYRARDPRSGEDVVLKEARPHAGLAADGADAVARLERERTALEQLAGLDCIPRLHGTFEVAGHHFLTLEHVPGTTLNTVFARRFPLSNSNPTPEQLAEHAEWARRMYGLVERAVQAVHERGVVISDLHMSNVMVSEDESRVVLLDFEAASLASEQRRQIVANPAFVAPADRRGVDIDRYALACLRLALLLPLTTLFAIDRGKVTRLVRDMTRIFPVTEEELRPAVTEILRGIEPTEQTETADTVTTAGMAADTAMPSAGRADAGAVARAKAPALSAVPGAFDAHEQPRSAVATLGPATGPDSAELGGPLSIASDATAQASRSDVAPPRGTEISARPAAATTAPAQPMTGSPTGEPTTSIPQPVPLPSRIPDPGEWPLSRDSMAHAILASCTPEREDRCFPGDIAQFASPAGGQSFGYGAAGILYALQETGAPPCPDAVEWLLARAKEPAPGTPIGFYDGLAGIAWTLRRLGHPEQAAELAQLIARQPVEGLTADLHGGYAGIALALDDLARTATGAEAVALAGTADHCTALAARALLNGPPSPRTGLLHGATGLALLFIRRYETTGDPQLLDLAATALNRDLGRCRPGAEGALLVIDGKRTMPYLGAGSAGVALVLDEYLIHRPDEAFAAARQAMQPAFCSAFYVQPGLFRGVAGLILQLTRTNVGDPGLRQRVIRRHIELLGLHAMPYAGGLAFPGEQLMRRSMDLATGTAGCLLALGSALGDTPAALPFLPPLPRPTDRSLPGTVHK